MYAVQWKDDSERRLEWLPTERPVPKEGQVLVQIRATALNRADLMQRRGLYPPPPGASEILGLEAAGTIVECVGDVENWSVGDEVCVLLEGGGYAQYVACDAGMLLSKPPTFSWEEAAALPEVYYTAYVNLILEGGLQPKERVLLHAAASGVGTAVLQLCQIWGNPVLATASANKREALEALGATAIFDRRREDLFEAIAAYTETMPHVTERPYPLESKGVDLIFDPVGGAYLEQNIRLLRRCGRLILIGLMGGSSGELDLGRLLMRRLRVMGSVLRSRSRAEKLVITDHMRRDVWPLFFQGKIKPLLYRTFPIEEANDAHDLMASNESIGKIVLRVDHPGGA